MIKTKVTFLEGQLLSSQSEQFKKNSKSSDCWKRAGPIKKLLLFYHINRLIICLIAIKCSRPALQVGKLLTLKHHAISRIIKQVQNSLQADAGL